MAPVRCRHRSVPGEPFARPGLFGLIMRVAPAGRGIPALAFVEWDGFSTWERLSDLKGIGDRSPASE